jgi:hypothetical protein
MLIFVSAKTGRNTQEEEKAKFLYKGCCWLRDLWGHKAK